MAIALANVFFSHFRYVTNMKIIAMRRTSELNDGEFNFVDEKIFMCLKFSSTC